MICVALSPLAKIFCKKFYVEQFLTDEEFKAARKDNPKATRTKRVELTQEHLVKNPELITKEENFSIKIRRSCGDVEFVYGKPRNINDRDLSAWLTGGPDGDWKQETDWAGIAALPLDIDTEGTIMGMIAGEVGDQPEIRQAVKTSMETAKAISRKRVMRQVRKVFDSMKSQYQQCKEQNLGMYTPSNEERLCLWVLAADEAKTEDEQRELNNKFADLIKKIVI